MEIGTDLCCLYFMSGDLLQDKGLKTVYNPFKLHNKISSNKQKICKFV